MCSPSPPCLPPQRLQELHLQDNSIELLGDQALSGLTSLALLDLSRNHLRTLGPSSLKALVSLQVLRVTGEPCPRTGADARVCHSVCYLFVHSPSVLLLSINISIQPFFFNPSPTHPLTFIHLKRLF